MPAEVLEPLAEAADGYRTLDGWLAKLELSSRVDRREVAPDLVGAILQGDPVDGPSLDEIARAVAGRFGLKLRDLKGATRRAVVAEGRHLAMYLARRHTRSSFRAIGLHFGGRDPATVRHACLAAADRISADPALPRRLRGPDPRLAGRKPRRLSRLSRGRCRSPGQARGRSRRVRGSG